MEIGDILPFEFKLELELCILQKEINFLNIIQSFKLADCQKETLH